MGAAGLGGPDDVVLYRRALRLADADADVPDHVSADGVIPMEASLAVRNEPFPAEAA